MAQNPKSGSNPPSSSSSGARPVNPMSVPIPPAKQSDAPGTGPRILRVGILQNGKMVEERLIRKRVSVSIGQSSHNTFVVPASELLPRSFTLFEIGAGGYSINFTEQMDGRVAFDQASAPQTLSQLKGKAERKADAFHLPVPDRSRGKVVIGDTTVLFQFVTPPPVQPRPQLPASVRGSLAQSLDWVMIAVAGISLVGHVGFVTYLRNVDFPKKPDIEEIPDRFVQMIVPKKEEKKVEKVDPNANKVADKDDKKKAKADDSKKVAAKPKDPEAEARAAAERRARMQQEVASMGALKILGAKGEDGSLMDTLKGGGVSGDADRVFAQVGGVGVAGTGGVGLGSKGAGGAGNVKGIGGLRAAGPGDVGTGDKGGEREAKVKGILKESEPTDFDGSDASYAQVVTNELRRRKGAIVACYERALKRNPNLSGKVELQLTISSVGKVTGADIGTDTMHDDEVTSCITSIAKSWRLTAPGSEVHIGYPFVFQSSK